MIKAWLKSRAFLIHFCKQFLNWLYQITAEWYNKHLGLNTDKYGTGFVWYQDADSTKKGYTQWRLFSSKTKYSSLLKKNS